MSKNVNVLSMKNENKKIAVVGSGIAGLSFSYIGLKNNLDISLFEKNNYFGGHSNTIDINVENKIIPVDTGFLVHNKLTYPNLIQLFTLLDVEIVDSEMSLSIKTLENNIEWCGTNLNTVFSQRKNIFNFKFLKFIYEINNFNNRSQEFLAWAQSNKKRTLGDLLTYFSYSEMLTNWYIIPMAAAIWSTPASKILEFPAYTFLTFSINHHLLQINNRPTWRTIKNGSRIYVKKITDLIEKKYLNQNIQNIEYKNNKIFITTNGNSEEFDLLIFAGHPDQAISSIKGLNNNQLDILNSFKYEKNIAYVHSDENFLPSKKSIWSSWNYVSSKNTNKVSVSYLINKLQPLETSIPIIVTLNPHEEVNPNLTYRMIEYEHPLFDNNAIEAQDKISSIQGMNNIYFAGAWQGFGFHEDGIKSAVMIAKQMGLKIPWNV
jgi:predicted NAD/FAD-binding protein